ncbi:MAG: HEPN domain-containing protein [Bacteroidales bacterium]
MKNRTTDWLTVAEDDLSAIILIIKDAGLTHIVAFHAQQVIEKALKAVIEEFELLPEGKPTNTPTGTRSGPTCSHNSLTKTPQKL